MKNMARSAYVIYLLATLILVAWVLAEQASFKFFGMSLIYGLMWAMPVMAIVIFHTIVVEGFINKPDSAHDFEIQERDVVFVRNFIIVFLTGINASIFASKLGLTSPYALSFGFFLKLILVCFFVSIIFVFFKKLTSPSEKFFLGIKKVEEED